MHFEVRAFLFPVGMQVWWHVPFLRGARESYIAIPNSYSHQQVISSKVCDGSVIFALFTS